PWRARGRSAERGHSAVLRDSWGPAGDPCPGGTRRSGSAGSVVVGSELAQSPPARPSTRREAGIGRFGDAQRGARVSDALQPVDDGAVRSPRDAAGGPWVARV